MTTFEQVGKTVDPPGKRGFFGHIMNTFKTWNTLRKLRKADPSIDFKEESFLVEAERTFAQVLAAMEDGDKSTLRDLITENYFSRIKKDLPSKEKRRGSPKTVVKTETATLVQARRIQLTRPLVPLALSRLRTRGLRCVCVVMVLCCVVVCAYCTRDAT